MSFVLRYSNEVFYQMDVIVLYITFFLAFYTFEYVRCFVLKTKTISGNFVESYFDKTVA